MDSGTVGFYSTASMIKYTTKPIVSINQMDVNALNSHLYTYEGLYYYHGDVMNIDGQDYYVWDKYTNDADEGFISIDYRKDNGYYWAQILTEKLYGMRNFIRDFSKLDEATKKHLVLWKEFLIYAVVLEENDNVLREE